MYMYAHRQKQQLRKNKFKTYEDWHVVVRHTHAKQPAARKRAGHVQCELMLVFHTSCGFQEKERVNSVPSAEPYNHKHQQRPALTARTFQFTKVSDKVRLIIMSVSWVALQ